MGPQIVELPEKKKLTYWKFRHEVEIPISIGADFECALSDVSPDDCLAPTSAKQHHVPVTVALKVSSKIFPSMDLPVRSYTGSDCVEWFHDQLDEIHALAKPFLERIVPMERITKEERKELYKVKECYLCKKQITSWKSIDHCHFTGNNTINIKLRYQTWSFV